MADMRSVLKGLPRGVASEAAPQPALAVFADPASIATVDSLRYGPRKLFLGVVGGQVETTRDSGGNVLRYVRGGTQIGIETDQHAITIAGSRTGKGRAAILPNLLRYAGSVLAVDPKGELALASAEVRAKKLKQRVHVLDPFGTTGEALKGYRATFNPLAKYEAAQPDFSGVVEDAALIADALIVTSERDPHWDESARTFIEGVIVEVATAPRFKGRRNLLTVRDLIASGDVSEIEAEVQENPVPRLDVLENYMRTFSKVDLVRRAAADFFDRPDKERDSVLSSARRHLRAMNYREIEETLKGGSLDLSTLKKENATVYLCLPGRHMGTCGRWLRLFVNMALQAMEKTPGKPSVPVLFVLDEFATLGPMRQIEDAAGQIAGYGVKLWPILQDLGQLKALYKDRWETFMGNAGILQFFGNNDLTTLEWISKRLGTTTIQVYSGNPPKPGDKYAGADYQNWSAKTVALMEPHEIALYFGRADDECRQLVIRADKVPMILQRAFADKHEALIEAARLP